MTRILLLQEGIQHDYQTLLNLRTVPTIVTAHTFCASRDTRVSYGWCLLIREYFCAAENYTEKAELSKCFWYLIRKLGVTMHFSEIIKLQFRKKSQTLLYILAVFRDIIAYLSLKNAWLPPSFFLDFNSPCQDLLFLHSHKPDKNTSVLVGTVLKSNRRSLLEHN